MAPIHSPTNAAEQPTGLAKLGRRMLRAAPLKRHGLAWLLQLCLLMGTASTLHAQQLEEPLIDSVRSALQAAIANSIPPEPIFVDTESRLAYLRWLTATSDKLAKRMPNVAVRHEFLQTVWYESKRAGLDTAMVLGLIQVESGFRKHVISYAGARGFMQIMPFWTRVIGDDDAAKLFHMQTNLRFGNVILRHYLEIEKGDLFMALGRYNGSRGRATYPNAVLAAQRFWEFNDPGAAVKEASDLQRAPASAPALPENVPAQGSPDVAQLDKRTTDAALPATSPSNGA